LFQEVTHAGCSCKRLGGVGKEKAKTVVRNIIKVFVNLSIPSHAVEVIVHEIQKSHWGVGGEPASEKFKDIAP
jgi:4-oxalocrotonate tautomerase